jgi:hypothetical protein
MMAFAQGLPVVRIPEPLVVTLMTFDVVDHGGGRHQAFAFAEDAQGMLREVGCAGLLPSRGVAALAR